MEYCLLRNLEMDLRQPWKDTVSWKPCLHVLSEMLQDKPTIDMIYDPDLWYFRI